MKPYVKACAAAALLLTACADKPTSPSDIAPQMSSVTTGTLQITLLGPDGTSICNNLPAGFNIRVRAVDRTMTPDQSRRAKTLVCPVNSDTMSNLIFGPDYLLALAMYSAGAAASRIPDTYVMQNGFSFTTNMSKSLKIFPSDIFTGRATVDGKYEAGIPMTLKPMHTDYFYAATAYTSDATGVWRTTSYGERAYLQKGLSYIASCGGDGLGLASPPADVGPFMFPADSTGLSCSMTSSPSKQWSHRATNVTFTPWDGVWGGAVEGMDGITGHGWGLQYPVEPTKRPSRDMSSSHNFFGGLIFAVNGSIVSLVDLSGYNFVCGATCEDHEITGLDVVVRPDKSKRVTWQMNDESSPDGRGLTVTQVTYDGIGGDYILFKLDLRNRNDTRMNVFAGTVNDWDVQNINGPGSNVGGITGDISYVSGSSTTGPFMGTVFFGNYATRANRFFGFSSETLSLSTQVEWLKGLHNNTSFGPADVRSMQSVGPVSIAPGARKTVYLAIVAGATQAEMVANRNAAAAHYASLTGGAAASLVEPAGVPVLNATSAARTSKVGKAF